MRILSLLGQMSTYDYAPNSGASNSTALSAEASANLVLGIMIFMLIASVIVYIITALSLNRIFKKAGVESWKAWVPVYNMWTMLELGGQKGYWAIVALIPVINLAAVIFIIIAMYYIGLKLGKPGAFILVGIFLPLVWYVWLAVDKSTWHNSVNASQPSNLTPAHERPASKDNDNQPTAI